MRRSIDVNAFQRATEDQRQAMRNWIADRVAAGEMDMDENWISEICIKTLPKEDQRCVVWVHYFLPDASGKQFLWRDNEAGEREAVQVWGEHGVATPPPFHYW